MACVVRIASASRQANMRMVSSVSLDGHALIREIERDADAALVHRPALGCARRRAPCAGILPTARQRFSLDTVLFPAAENQALHFLGPALLEVDHPRRGAAPLDRKGGVEVDLGAAAQAPLLGRQPGPQRQ